MTKHGLLLLGILLGATSLVTATGCGDEGSGGSGGSGSSSSSTSSSSSSGSAAFDCSAHCDTVMANCSGANAQYADKASCMAVCALMPQDGMSGATSGNTMQCRDYHAGAAKDAAATHCQHAGPSGGGVCGDDICVPFCAIATATCKTEWPAAADCTTACTAWTSTMMPYSTSATGNTSECRLYHLTVATVDAATHCSHTVDMSPVCM